MQLLHTPSGAENEIESFKKMTFDSNQKMLQHLAGLGCDISRIEEKNGILMIPAGGKPDALMYKLSEERDGRIVFDLVAQFQMERLITGLKKTTKEWIDQDKAAAAVRSKIARLKLDAMLSGLPNPFQIDYSQLPGCENFHQKSLEQKMEGLELGDDEVCGILRKRVNGRGWYLDRDNPLIQEKNKEGYKGNVPIIPKIKKQELLINEMFTEGNFVVARIENNEIVELFNESAWQQ